MVNIYKEVLMHHDCMIDTMWCTAQHTCKNGYGINKRIAIKYILKTSLLFIILFEMILKRDICFVCRWLIFLISSYMSFIVLPAI